MTKSHLQSCNFKWFHIFVEKYSSTIIMKFGMRKKSLVMILLEFGFRSTEVSNLSLVMSLKSQSQLIVSRRDVIWLRWILTLLRGIDSDPHNGASQAHDSIELYRSIKIEIRLWKRKRFKSSNILVIDWISEISISDCTWIELRIASSHSSRNASSHRISDFLIFFLS